MSARYDGTPIAQCWFAGWRVRPRIIAMAGADAAGCAPVDRQSRPALQRERADADLVGEAMKSATEGAGSGREKAQAVIRAGVRGRTRPQVRAVEARAVCCRTGDGVQRDELKAFNYFRRSSDSYG